MDIYPLILGLLGAFCWGLAPIFGKLGLRGVNPIDGLAARTLVTLSFVLAWLAMSGRYRELGNISRENWLFIGAEAFLATLAGDLAYYAALKWGTAGGAAVALSVSPVVTVWASSLLLSESFSPVQLIGVALVALGVLMVAAG